MPPGPVKNCTLCKHPALQHPGFHTEGMIRACYGCAKEVSEGKREQDKICEMTQWQVMDLLR